MTTTIDFDALQVSEGPRVTLLENREVGGGLVGDDFADFSAFASLSVDVKVQRLSSTSPPPLLTLLVEHSDDGLSWSTAETFTFTDDGERTASLASPKAHVRARASGSGAEWYVKSVNVAPISGGGGGSTPGIPLEDPGNVYEPNTAVIIGHQIAETVQDELRVFEVTIPGTTGGNPFSDYVIHLEPLGETPTGPVVWRHLGIVGQVSWENAPLLPGVTVDEDGFHVASSQPTSEAETFFQLLPAIGDPGNVWEAETAVEGGYRIAVTLGGASRVFEVVGVGTTGAIEPTWVYDPIGWQTTDGSAVWSYRGVVGGPDTDRPVFVANTAGDADWFLDQNNGSGFRFNQSIDGVPDSASGSTEMTTDGFKVYTATESFEVQYSPFSVTVLGLPTGDPLSEGQLWNDAGTLKISAGPP